MARTTAYTDGSGEELIEEIRILAADVNVIRQQATSFERQANTDIERIDAHIERLHDRINDIIAVLERCLTCGEPIPDEGDYCPDCACAAVPEDVRAMKPYRAQWRWEEEAAPEIMTGAGANPYSRNLTQ